FNDKSIDPEDYTEGGLDWGNATGVVRWNHVLTKKLFSNLTATFTSYNFDIFDNLYSTEQNDQGEDTETLFGFEYFSGIRDIALKEDIDFIPNPKHYIKMGAGVIQHTFMPRATE